MIHHLLAKTWPRKPKSETLRQQAVHARGPVADTDALARALSERWISYAALDVTDPEPLPPSHPLYALEVYGN